MNYIDMEGADIKAIRSWVEQTQAEFAKSLNIPLRTLQNWESNHRKIPAPMKTLLKHLSTCKEFQRSVK